MGPQDTNTNISNGMGFVEFVAFIQFVLDAIDGWLSSLISTVSSGFTYILSKCYREHSQHMATMCNWKYGIAPSVGL